MADKKIKVGIDIDVNAEPSIAQLKALKKELKNAAAGSEEFNKIYNQIDDLEDKIKSAKNTSADWIDSLESAGGPLGALGGALNKLKLSTQSFGAALKATGIGLVVAAIGGLVGAFSQTDGAMKKLEPLMIAFQKILGGILEAMMPLIDAFIDLAVKALPYVTQGVKVFYSSLVALFTLVKEGGGGIAQILKGIFTLDKAAIKEGYAQLTGTWAKTVEAFDATGARFEEGYAKRTRIEKENYKNSKELADKALAEKLKRLEAEDKLDEARLAKMKAEAMETAFSEEQKLFVEQEFAKKSYELKKKDLEDKQALYKKDSIEYKELEAQKIQLDADRLEQLKTFNEQRTKLQNELEILMKKPENDITGMINSKDNEIINLQQQLQWLDHNLQYQKDCNNEIITLSSSNVQSSEISSSIQNIIDHKTDYENTKIQLETHTTQLNNIEQQIDVLNSNKVLILNVLEEQRTRAILRLSTMSSRSNDEMRDNEHILRDDIENHSTQLEILKTTYANLEHSKYLVEHDIFNAISLSANPDISITIKNIQNTIIKLERSNILLSKEISILQSNNM